MFRLMIPVQELLGIETGDAEVDVNVRVNKRWHCVVMKATCVTFGRPELDRHLTVSVRLALHRSDDRLLWNRIRFRRRRSDIDALLEDFQQLERTQSSHDAVQQPLEADPMSFNSFDAIQIETDLPEQEKTDESDAAEGDGGNWARLNCAAQLHLTIRIPPFLSTVPRIVLGSCGRFIVRYLMNRILRRILEHVVSDYHAWASGAPRGHAKNGGLFHFDDVPESDDAISADDEPFGQAWRQ